VPNREPTTEDSSAEDSPEEGSTVEDSASGLPRLPPGRHGLSREFVAQNQRDRLAAGIIAAVTEHGYHETTISQISAAAGVSRRTFYSYFSSKEECFLATYDQICDHLRRAAGEAAAEQSEWPRQVAARFGGVMNVFATNPQLARFTLAVPRRAGDAVAVHYRDALDQALAELTAGMPSAPEVNPPSQPVQHSLMGGVVSLIVHKLETGEGDDILELLPDLVELFLAPFLGRAEAVRLANEVS
jgi:AcrR family transcriptional regulator